MKLLLAAALALVLVVGGLVYVRRSHEAITVSGHLSGQMALCAFGASAPSETVLLNLTGPDPAQRQITFKGSDGTILATATTGSSSWQNEGTTCTEVAPYSVRLPRSDFYSVQVQGVSQPFTASWSDVSSGRFSIAITQG